MASPWLLLSNSYSLQEEQERKKYKYGVPAMGSLCLLRKKRKLNEGHRDIPICPTSSTPLSSKVHPFGSCLVTLTRSLRLVRTFVFFSFFHSNHTSFSHSPRSFKNIFRRTSTPTTLQNGMARPHLRNNGPSLDDILRPCICRRLQH